MAVAPRKGRPFAVEIQFEGTPEKPIDIEAYLFDRAGAFLASAPFSKGQAQFTLDQVPKDARLLVGPTRAALQRVGEPSLAMMQRLDAYEPGWNYDPGIEIYELRQIPDYYWPHWPLCHCRVRGRVVKRSTSPGGVVVEAPICDARVHICEVDPFYWVLERLPEIDILRLRDELWWLIERPFPWPPIPEPDPPPDWLRGVVDPSDLRGQNAQEAAVKGLFGRSAGETAGLNPQPLPPMAMSRLAMSRPAVSRLAMSRLASSADTHSAEGRATINPQPLPPAMMSGAQMLRLPDLAQFTLRSPSAEVVRRGLIDHIEYLRPWLCYWDWLEPWFLLCDELRVVMTNDDGEFDTTIYYPCYGDQPDLYFWVECSIGGVWTTVYAPPIRCHTWWDYPCGTFVTIGVTDPRVTGCGEQPVLSGLQVVVKTIGYAVSMGEINRTGDPEPQGTVKSGWIEAARASPFGETVEPRVDFGTGLKPAGITHYRWSYRTLGSVLETDWLPLQDQVSRHSRETTAPGDPAIYKSVIVGPDPAVSGYFFQVDPVLPAGGEKFEVLDERIDLASARWDTTEVADGSYELKLELFRLVGTVMTRVDLTTEGVTLSQIIDPAPLSAGTYVTQLASGDRLLTQGGHIVGYRLVLSVDNRVCHGTIDSVTVAPGKNDTKCGFLEYAAGASATITFHASHPANWARFSFKTVRVAMDLPSASSSGLVDASAPNGFNRVGDTFSKTVAVATLLSEGVVPPDIPCIRAAFAESLVVAALATNGYGRLSYLDAPQGPGEIALRGFALTPS